MKKAITFLLIILLCLTLSVAEKADEKKTEKKEFKADDNTYQEQMKEKHGILGTKGSPVNNKNVVETGNGVTLKQGASVSLTKNNIDITLDGGTADVKGYSGTIKIEKGGVIKYKDEIIAGPDTEVLVFTSEDDFFKNDQMVKLFKKSGASVPFTDLKGARSKDKIITAIEKLGDNKKENYVIAMNGHGDEDSFILSNFYKEGKTNLKHPRALSYKEIADAIYESGVPPEKISIVSAACIHYNCLTKIDAEVKRLTGSSLGLLSTAANKDQIHVGDLRTNGMLHYFTPTLSDDREHENLYYQFLDKVTEQGKPFKVGHLFEVDRELFEFDDSSLRIRVPQEEGEEGKEVEDTLIEIGNIDPEILKKLQLYAEIETEVS